MRIPTDFLRRHFSQPKSSSFHWRASDLYVRLVVRSAVPGGKSAATQARLRTVLLFCLGWGASGDIATQVWR